MDMSTRCQSGQAGIEFMVILGVTLLIFIMLGYMVFQNHLKSSDLKVYISGVHLANHISDSINTLNAVGLGYSTTLSIPDTLYGHRDYRISFFENESSVFVTGSSFAKGHELTYSSPVSTSSINCLLSQCEGRCNGSAAEECLRVNGSMTIRLVRYVDGIYLTPEHNVRQGNMGEHITAYTGEKDIDPDAPEDFLWRAGDKWNAMYVYRNLADETVSLVFRMNLSGSERARMDFTELMGEVVEVKSNDTGPPELDLEAEPEANWMNGGGSYDIDGGVIKFRGGFNICIDPDQMPAQEWVLLNPDGSSIILDKSETVCITYP